MESSQFFFIFSPLVSEKVFSLLFRKFIADFISGHCNKSHLPLLRLKGSSFSLDALYFG